MITTLILVGIMVICSFTIGWSVRNLVLIKRCHSILNWLQMVISSENFDNPKYVEGVIEGMSKLLTLERKKKCLTLGKFKPFGMKHF